MKPQDIASTTRPHCPAGRSNSALTTEIAEQLQQPWQLLTDAGTFVVLANDSYILKLFKNVDAIITKFRSWGTDLGSARLTPFPGDERATANWMAGAVVDATTFAWEYLRAEAALNYLHLTHSDDLPDITVDGVQLSIKQRPFVVQRRGQMLKSRIDELMEKGDETAARGVLDDWATFQLSQWKRGVATHPNFDENYGYVDDKLTLFDVGDVRFGSSAIQQDIDAELITRYPAFQKLEAKYPSLATYLVEVAKERLYTFNTAEVGMIMPSQRSQARTLR